MIVPTMKEENLKAVEALREKIRAKEEEARQLKIVVNGFYTDEGEAAPYPDANIKTAASIQSLRSDLFYGNTIAEAAQLFLEMKKASGLGSASVNEIYAALKSGGYAFDTKNEEYAKNGLRISLRKNKSIFHQLPGGDYGLCVWYGVKGVDEESRQSRKRSVKRRPKASPPKSSSGESKHTESPEINGAAKTKEANRQAAGIADNSGVLNVGDFEKFVREKARRVRDVAEHFHVSESTVKKLVEPASKVYFAGVGWLKVRE